jgi:hypothetical protein
MKALIGIVATGFLTMLLLEHLPWWWCGVIAFVVALGLQLKPGIAFVMGLLGVALAWGMMAEWIDVQNNSILSTKIGALFGGVSTFVVILITTALGGLVGGFGGMTGGALSTLISRRNSGSSDRTP